VNRSVYTRIYTGEEPVLADHSVLGVNILPGAGVVAQALAALEAAELPGPSALTSLRFLRPIVCGRGERLELTVTIERSADEVVRLRVRGRPAGSDSAKWEEYARGRVVPRGEPQRLDLTTLRMQRQGGLDPAWIWATMRRRGFILGPYFHSIEGLWGLPTGGVLGVVAVTPQGLPDLERYPVSPSMLDGIFQMSIGSQWTSWTDLMGDLRTLGPFQVDDLALFGPMPRRVTVVATMVPGQDPQGPMPQFQCCVCADDGTVVLSFVLVATDITEGLLGKAEGPADGSSAVAPETGADVRKDMSGGAGGEEAATSDPLLARFLWARPVLDLAASAALSAILHGFGLTGAVGTGEALAAAAGVAPQHRRQFGLLLRLAAADGLVREVDGQLIVLGERAAAEATWAQIGREVPRVLPEFAGELGLLGTCVDAYPAVLRGRRDATGVLLPFGSLAALAVVFRDAPLAVRDASIAARWLERRLETSSGPVTVLEVGAGTGGTTAGLVPVLQRAAGRVEYHFTDVTPVALAHAERRFAGLGLRTGRFDVEHEPGAQGYARASFDVIVAAHVLHATRDVDAALRHIRGLLRPGGALLLIETTEALRPWSHLILGLSPEWWRFDGADGRSATPLLPAQAWRERLERGGFSGVRALAAGGPTSVMIAEADPAWREETSVRAEASEASEAATAVRRSEVATLGVPVEGAEPGLVRRLERMLVAQLAATLRMPAQRIGGHTPFPDLGLDSLLAQELAASLERWVGAPVPSGIVFQYTTARALATFLAASFPEALRARVSKLAQGTDSAAQASGRAIEDVAVATGEHEPGQNDMSLETGPKEQATRDMSPGTVAIVGYAARLPGAASADALWEVLARGEVAIGEMPPGRTDLAALRGRVACERGAFLPDISGFDRAMFGMSAGEAAGLDPRHRIALELAYAALEHAGRGGPGRAGMRVGVYLGLSRELPSPTGADPLRARAEATLGLSLAMAAARICHALDLRGPSQTIDVHCAAGLVALHQACAALTAGECDLALVGAVNVLADPAYWLAMDHVGMLSPTGRCRPFAADGDGFVLGEGGVMLVLRPVAAAYAAGDPIHAVVLGTAVGHNGRTMALGAPSVDGHADVVRAAWRRAGVDATAIDALEAHGTGTRLGDAIEVQGLRAAFTGVSTRCVLGSLKGQLGHTEVVAGLAGVLKVILALRREQWPATVTGPALVAELQGGPLVPATQPVAWPRGGRRRIAGVTAFGLAGTGAHAVLAEGPIDVPRTGDARGADLLLLSAPSAGRLAVLAGELAGVASTVDPGDLCLTVGAGRARLAWRAAAVVYGTAELRARLSEWAGTEGQRAAGTEAQASTVVIALGPVRVTREWLALAEVREAVLTALEAAAPTDQAEALEGFVGGAAGPLAEFGLLYGIGRALQRLVPAAEFAGRGIGAAVAAVLAGDVPLVTAVARRAEWSLAHVHEDILLREPPGPVIAVGAVEGEVVLALAGEDPWAAVLAALAGVFVRGGDVDVEALYAGKGRRRVPLPGLQFAREPEPETVARVADGPRVAGASGVVVDAAGATAGEGVTIVAGTAMRPGGETLRGAALRRAILGLLQTTVAEELQVAPVKVDPRASLMALGLDSLTLERLVVKLGQWTGVALSPTLMFRLPTLDDVALYLAREHAPAMCAALAEAAVPGGRPAPRRETASAGEGSGASRGHDGPRYGGVFAGSGASHGSRDRSEIPIAILGMAGRFPQAEDPAALWELLIRGGDAITEIPPERWGLADFYSPDPAAPGRSDCKWAALLSAPDRFDPEFFGISRREARGIDPQQRLFLTVAWEALEHAGRAGGLRGRAVGVFVGSTTSDFSEVLMREDAPIGPHLATGLNGAMLANRVSYTFDLRGPSMMINTACSSSLVAIHQACESLRAGECELAIAGGVNLCLTPTPFVALSKARALSRTGRCRPFGVGADGYVRGEGAGAVVLKRLDAALSDGDSIVAVIRGSAVNQDGRTNGVTAPNPVAQQAVIEAALRRAGVDPESIDYIEAHGTGTRLGDPIEVEALAAGHGRRSRCWLGSIKSNIGHLEAAAGVASLIKVVLSLQHEELPPTLHAAQVNPLCGFDRRPFVPVQARTPWTGAERRAALSSFGFGGTNCHMIVEAAPVAPARASGGPLVLVLSAPTEAALGESARRWAAALASGQDTADLCFTAAVGRARFAWRLAVTADDATGLARALRRAAEGANEPGILRGVVEGTTEDEADSIDRFEGAVPVLGNLADGAGAAAAFVRGEPVAWDEVFGAGRRRVAAPRTPRHEIGLAAARTRAEVTRRATIDGAMPVADHRMFGSLIVPSACLHEWMLAAGAELVGAPVRRLRGIVHQRPLLGSPEGVAVALRLQLAQADGESSIHLRAIEQKDASALAFASLSTAALERPAPVDLLSLSLRCTRAVEPASVYARAAASGLECGPFFRTLAVLRIGAEESLAELRAPGGTEGFLLHPGLVEGAVLAGCAVAFAGRDDAALLPMYVEELRWYAPLPERVLCWARIHPVGPDPALLRADLTLAARDGVVLAEFVGLRLRRVLRPTDPSQHGGGPERGEASGARDRSATAHGVAEHLPPGAAVSTRQGLEDTGGKTGLGVFTAAQSGPRMRTLEGWIAARLAVVLERDVDRIGRNTPFIEFGLDSLMAVEIATAIRAEFGAELTPTLFFDHPTITEMAMYLAGLTPETEVNLP
jgi:acyl transferase domain-containing protein/SAM-dependent methyltransferase